MNGLNLSAADSVQMHYAHINTHTQDESVQYFAVCLVVIMSHHDQVASMGLYY